MTSVEQAYTDVAREHVALPLARLRELVAARLGRDPGLDGPELLDDPGSPLVTVAPDLVVHVPALTAGIVLTHRLSAAEHVAEYLDLDTDLAGFLRVRDPHVPSGPLEVDDLAWVGPPGWLAALPLDALLAVRVLGDGSVEVSVLEEDPPAGPVEALRAAYAAEVAETRLPVPAELLVVGMLLRDREAFARPLPPLTELAAAAGLEQRGDEFADDPAVWAAADEVDREIRLLDLLGDDAAVAREALELLSSPDPAVLRRALDLLGQPDVLLVVVDELLDEHGDPSDADRVAALVALADRLLAVAGRSPRAAVAGWIAAVAAERDGRVLDAESHLRAAAAAAEGWELVEDRLAAYESDRGDAAAALGRWLALDAGDDDPDVVVVRPFATASGPEPGRNEPCCCGSGRKYKQCHLGRPAAAPLAERARWLHQKAVGYLERRGGAATELLDLHAEVFHGALDDTEDDPIVADTVLDEGGWFARFLADRGPLLPSDERELAAKWLPVRRSLFEVLGGGQVREVRTGERLTVAGVVAGGFVCARALPDGAGRHLLVAPVAVERDAVGLVMSVLAERDAMAVLDLLAVDVLEPRTVLHAPPPPARPAAVAPVVLQLQERREQRWCDEPTPALDGLSPRAAAADPTRRAALLALIAAAPPDDPATGKLGLRPARLRELLGLE